MTATRKFHRASNPCSLQGFGYELMTSAYGTECEVA